MPFDKKNSMPYKLSGKTKFSMASCVFYKVAPPIPWPLEADYTSRIYLPRNRPGTVSGYINSARVVSLLNCSVWKTT